MKFPCLAYGAEADWVALTTEEQNDLLAWDEALSRRGDLVAAVRNAPTIVRAWDGTPVLTPGAFAESAVRLAGFDVIEAADFEEAVRLVSQTPCARAKGAITLREIV